MKPKRNAHFWTWQFGLEANGPSTKQLLNNFWGDFLEKLKHFSGRQSKMDGLYKKKVYVDYIYICIHIYLTK